MSNYTDRENIPVGQKFGKRTVLGLAPDHPNDFHVLVFVRCDCGKVTSVPLSYLRAGRRQCCKFCGALPQYKHGSYKKNPEYSVWSGMRRRCLKPNNARYADYGGRGITICPEWSDFRAFLRDMGPRPSLAYSIERIDNDGPYAPSNCRWATTAEQNRNTRVSALLTFDGRTMTLSEWAREKGLKTPTLSRRLNAYGWSVERALTTPVGKS